MLSKYANLTCILKQSYYRAALKITQASMVQMLPPLLKAANYKSSKGHVGGQVSARGTGDACGPCSTPSAITLYTASVGCVPSQDPYVDGSLQTEHPGLPHGTVWFPQQVRRAFVNPASITLF